MDYEKTIKNILVRIERLERHTLSKKTTVKKDSKEETLSGPKGGVSLLISKHFFNKKRTAVETSVELEKHDYVYVISVVQTTLNRLSTKTGPLVAIKQGGKKLYVKRK